MTKEQVLNELRRLNSELRKAEQIAFDIEGNQSDDVIRARKEANRIKHDIAYLLETKAAA